MCDWLRGLRAGGERIVSGGERGFATAIAPVVATVIALVVAGGKERLWMSDTLGLVLVNFTTVEREGVAGGAVTTTTLPATPPSLRPVSKVCMTSSDSSKALLSDSA